jgi:GH25 family lysozyme M1 (1,4-beta-N-acetylmuramidase)
MTVLGMDVSHYQGIPNYPPEIKFVFIKASEGALGTDDKFAAHKAAAVSHGVLWSAYHFFRPLQDPVVQAKHFHDIAGDCQLPPVVDVEKHPYDPVLKAAPISGPLGTFLAEADHLFGRKLMIYTSYYYWRDSVQKPALGTDRLLWLAQYVHSAGTMPTGYMPTGAPLRIPDPWRSVAFWQFEGDQKPVSWMTGNTDWDLWMGDEASLYALSGANPPPPPMTLEERVTDLERRVTTLETP